MPIYTKKPVDIEAFEWSGDIDEATPAWFLRAVIDSDIHYESTRGGKMDSKRTNWRISTLEGEMKISSGDFVIKGVQGEIYPCKPDIFKATYEAKRALTLGGPNTFVTNNA